ncbi:hypothetical protein [Streptomyces sp. H34-S4]|uniref:hypothetical protein n=1 Tax=Streptomyces sp. H34-S4 TaxID=2996463 RepID=UPI002271AC08|nr:hypothetical protein [Streptomyces sp. H34-S4]MCY0936783.1 hypothetical protein [Streptomyces sp. H34-S4]
MKRDIHFERSIPPAGLIEALDLLARARKAVDDAYGSDGQLSRVALHLIDCAADASALLCGEDGLEAAREALGSARSAVVAATAAVHVIHDATRV